MTDRLDLLDYYTLLEIDQTATADAIRRAYHTFALKFHPDNHLGAEDVAKLARATQIFRRGAEAYRVLLNPRTRTLYDVGLSEGRLRLSVEAQRGPERASRSPQKMNRKAHMFFVKADKAVKREDWQTAKLNLKIAAQHDPDNLVIQSKLVQVDAKLAEKKKRRV